LRVFLRGEDAAMVVGVSDVGADPEFRNGVLDPGVIFLQKPTSLAELAKKMRAAIDLCSSNAAYGDLLVSHLRLG
jgi:hypothetical protein